MYEKPELTLVGDVRDTILGITINGDDCDGNYVWHPSPYDFESLPND